MAIALASWACTVRHLPGLNARTNAWQFLSSVVDKCLHTGSFQVTVWPEIGGDSDSETKGNLLCFLFSGTTRRLWVAHWTVTRVIVAATTKASHQLHTQWHIHVQEWYSSCPSTCVLASLFRCNGCLPTAMFSMFGIWSGTPFSWVNYEL